MTAETQENEGYATSRAHSSRLRCAWRILCMLAGTARVVPPYYIGQFRYKTEKERVNLLYRGTQDWLGAMARAIGVEVTVEGTPPEHGSFLAPNHITYADIAVLPVAARMWFVSKADVLKWPLFGWLFRFSRNLTVDRNDRRCLAATNDSIARRIQEGYNVCVFLEGTTSGGTALLPFRAPLLQPALDAGVDIVPVCITWRAGDPAIDLEQDIAYWRGTPMGPHVLRFLGFKGIHCTIRFGDPIKAEGDRKELAEKVHAAVQAMHEEAQRHPARTANRD
ncbi:MAG: 1-acyl-sn-glycerol-3-phosphate acyltransferase [Candidatus Hydrogenedentes bacterium]|nr:1-acyl-sn-glycerol-3-phosphate acyltransferase [Candidatus Hydrogenedentota bacterium]